MSIRRSVTRHRFHCLSWRPLPRHIAPISKSRILTAVFLKGGGDGFDGGDIKSLYIDRELLAIDIVFCTNGRV